MPMPEITLKWSPEFPHVGETVTIVAACDEGLTGVKLTVSRPNGEVLARGPVQVGKVGDLHTWTYELTPILERGVHELKFTANDIPDLAQVMLASVGAPREQYERTYVLLPPDADAAWALVVVEETWNDKRYTIGSSADDAGIGDLDIRRVIAINPTRWPSDLMKFYKEYYPGVELANVEADTPEQLRGRFQETELDFVVAVPS